MAIRDLLWVCPLCHTTGGLRPVRRADRCANCATLFRRGKGAEIVAVQPSGAVTRLPAREWLERIPPVDPADQPTELGPERVFLRTVVRMEPVHQNTELIGWFERFGPKRPGTLHLLTDRLRFDGEGGAVEWPLDRLTAVQPTSSALQIKARNTQVAAFRFIDGSLRLWDTGIQEAVRRTWRNAGRGEILEFLPRIRAQ